jgi:guanine deaminase
MMNKKLFVGTFVHSLSLKELEVLEHGAIGVDHGVIVFVEKNVESAEDVEEVKARHSFHDAEVIGPEDVTYSSGHRSVVQ